MWCLLRKRISSVEATRMNDFHWFINFSKAIGNNFNFYQRQPNGVFLWYIKNYIFTELRKIPLCNNNHRNNNYNHNIVTRGGPDYNDVVCNKSNIKEII